MLKSGKFHLERRPSSFPRLQTVDPAAHCFCPRAVSSKIKAATIPTTRQRFFAPIVGNLLQIRLRRPSARHRPLHPPPILLGLPKRRQAPAGPRAGGRFRPSSPPSRSVLRKALRGNFGPPPFCPKIGSKCFSGTRQGTVLAGKPFNHETGQVAGIPLGAPCPFEDIEAVPAQAN